MRLKGWQEQLLAGGLIRPSTSAGTSENRMEPAWRQAQRKAHVVTKDQRRKRISDSAKIVPASAQASVSSTSLDLECRQALSVTVTAEHCCEFGKTLVPELCSVIGSERQVAGKLSCFRIF